MFPCCPLLPLKLSKSVNRSRSSIKDIGPRNHDSHLGHRGVQCADRVYGK